MYARAVIALFKATTKNGLNHCPKTIRRHCPRKAFLTPHIVK